MSYSPAEGAAAGHCGNSGRSQGDNIYSLRDPQNRVHLTFVVNEGKLGEAKAPDNKKPLLAYHPAIVAFLTSGYVNGIDDEDSYLPENNFKMTDLPEEVCTPTLERMSAIEIPLKPANLVEPSHLLQFAQEKVDGMTSPEKKGLLTITINVTCDLRWQPRQQPNSMMGEFPIACLSISRNWSGRLLLL